MSRERAPSTPHGGERRSTARRPAPPAASAPAPGGATLHRMERDERGERGGRPAFAAPVSASASAEMQLDEVSDHLGEVLRHADELLAEWSSFGAEVRREVERSTAEMGDTVGRAIDASLDEAARRAATSAAAAVDVAVRRSLDERVGAQLRSLGAELASLEAKARAAAHHATRSRQRERLVLGGALIALCASNVLLVLLLVVWRPAATVVAPTLAPTMTPAPIAEPIGEPPPVNATAVDGATPSVTPAPVAPQAPTAPGDAGGATTTNAAPAPGAASATTAAPQATGAAPPAEAATSAPTAAPKNAATKSRPRQRKATATPTPP